MSFPSRGYLHIRRGVEPREQKDHRATQHTGHAAIGIQLHLWYAMQGEHVAILGDHRVLLHVVAIVLDATHLLGDRQEITYGGS